MPFVRLKAAMPARKDRLSLIITRLAAVADTDYQRVALPVKVLTMNFATVGF